MELRGWMYLTWQTKRDDTCKYFYLTSPFGNENDMFDIFYDSNQLTATHNDYYSPSCCLISHDNVGLPGYSSGLAACRCERGYHIDIIQGKPVMKKTTFTKLLGRN